MFSNIRTADCGSENSFVEYKNTTLWQHCLCSKKKKTRAFFFNEILNVLTRRNFFTSQNGAFCQQSTAGEPSAVAESDQA